MIIMPINRQCRCRYVVPKIEVFFRLLLNSHREYKVDEIKKKKNEATDRAKEKRQ